MILIYFGSCVQLTPCYVDREGVSRTYVEESHRANILVNMFHD